MDKNPELANSTDDIDSGHAELASDGDAVGRPRLVEEPNPSKPVLIWILFASLVGLFSAAVLTLEKITFWMNKAEGKDTALGCDLSPIVGCGPVINTDQASIFWDIPNPILGIIGFTLLALLAVLTLSGVRLKNWHWNGLQVGVTFAIIMVTWLQYQSIHNLHALCPYCMVVWAVTIPTFWVVTSFNLRRLVRLRFVHEWTTLYIAIHFVVLLAAIWFTFGATLWA